MAEEKKITPREAAVAVLAKAYEMLEKSELIKSEESRSKMSGKSGMVRIDTEANQNQKGVNQHGNNGSSGGRSQAGDEVRNNSTTFGRNGIANAKAIHKETLNDLKAQPKPKLTKGEEKAGENEIGTEFEKAEPKGEIHPKEHVEGEAEKVGERVEGQVPPGNNPKEQVEGNNPEWGAEPGHYKLAKFCGHMSAKRKMRKCE